MVMIRSCSREVRRFGEICAGLSNDSRQESTSTATSQLASTHRWSLPWHDCSRIGGRSTKMGTTVYTALLRATRGTPTLGPYGPSIQISRVLPGYLVGRAAVGLSSCYATDQWAASAAIMCGRISRSHKAQDYAMYDMIEIVSASSSKGALLSKPRSSVCDYKRRLCSLC